MSVSSVCGHSKRLFVLSLLSIAALGPLPLQYLRPDQPTAVAELAVRPWATGSSKATRTGDSAFSFGGDPFPLGPPGPENPPGPLKGGRAGSLEYEQSLLALDVLQGRLLQQQLGSSLVSAPTPALLQNGDAPVNLPIGFACFSWPGPCI